MYNTAVILLASFTLDRVSVRLHEPSDVRLLQGCVFVMQNRTECDSVRILVEAVSLFRKIMYRTPEFSGCRTADINTKCLIFKQPFLKQRHLE